MVVVGGRRVRPIGVARIQRDARRAEIVAGAAGGAARRLGSPAGAPASSHAANTAISSADNVRASAKSPHPAAGGQGGISPDCVAAAASAA